MSDVIKRTLIAMLAVGVVAIQGVPAEAEELDALAARVRALEDREAIRELLLEYGRALDRRDFEAFAALFAKDDGEWIGGFGSAQGRAAIFELMDRNIGHVPGGRPGTSFHVFSNDVISVDGDGATGLTKWIFVVQGEGDAPRWLYLGHYEDRFVREDGDWKFLRREAFTDIPQQAEPSD